MSDEQTLEPISLSDNLREVLTCARQEQGLSLSVVAETLKVSEKQLAFFEGEAFELNALTPFQRGYLRNYAKLLKVDLTPYHLEDLGKEQVSSKLQSIDSEPKPLVKLTFLTVIKWLLLVGLIALAVMLFLTGF